MADNEPLRRELLDMVARDQRVRAELAAGGELFGGYHPRMEAVHRANAARLAAILREHGWPGRALVGADGAEAAWVVLQHAVGEPELQRNTLVLLQEAVRSGEAEAIHAAHLEDRIRFLEGRPQRYGTQMDWNEDGLLGPGDIEDPDTVDERRAAVGLPPLARHVEEMRARAEAEGDRPPSDFEAYAQERRRWAERVGWREPT